MKAFNGSTLPKQNGLASSFSLTEKLTTSRVGETRPRRAPLNRYPDFGLQILLPPSQLIDQWLWKFVSRYSGATVPDSHGVP